MIIFGSLCKWWTVSDCPNCFMKFLEVYEFVPVRKNVTYIMLKFEFAYSPSPADPMPNIKYYNQRNTGFLFEHSQVVSVSKWNGLMGKEVTTQKEMHVDTNGKED